MPHSLANPVRGADDTSRAADRAASPNSKAIRRATNRSHPPSEPSRRSPSPGRQQALPRRVSVRPPRCPQIRSRLPRLALVTVLGLLQEVRQKASKSRPGSASRGPNGVTPRGPPMRVRFTSLGAACQASGLQARRGDASAMSYLYRRFERFSLLAFVCSGQERSRSRECRWDVFSRNDSRGLACPPGRDLGLSRNTGFRRTRAAQHRVRAGRRHGLGRSGLLRLKGDPDAQSRSHGERRHALHRRLRGPHRVCAVPVRADDWEALRTWDCPGERRDGSDSRLGRHSCRGAEASRVRDGRIRKVGPWDHGVGGRGRETGIRHVLRLLPSSPRPHLLPSLPCGGRETIPVAGQRRDLRIGSAGGLVGHREPAGLQETQPRGAVRPA